MINEIFILYKFCGKFFENIFKVIMINYLKEIFDCEGKWFVVFIFLKFSIIFIVNFLFKLRGLIKRIDVSFNLVKYF